MKRRSDIRDSYRETYNFLVEIGCYRSAKIFRSLFFRFAPKARSGKVATETCPDLSKKTFLLKQQERLEEVVLTVWQLEEEMSPSVADAVSVFSLL